MSSGHILGVLLAGGLARRMGGGDKCLLHLGESTLLEHAIARAKGQVGSLLINANGDPGRFKGVAWPVVPDSLAGFLGPLAGIHTAMEWAGANAPGVTHVASFATDTPFFPLNLVAQLETTRVEEAADIVLARSNDRSHPVFGLWPVALAADLRHALEVTGERKIDRWAGRHRLVYADFSANPTAVLDPFFNINTPDDLDRALTAFRSAVT